MRNREHRTMKVGGRILLAMAFIGVIAFGAVGPRSHYRREIAQVLRQITSAIQRKDTATFASFMADDYTATDTTGKVLNRDDVVKDWSRRIEAMHDFRWRRQIEKLTVHGKRVETVTKGHLIARIATPDKKDHDLVVDATTVDQWEKTDGKWLNHGSKLLSFVTKFDGKVIPSK